MKITIHPHIVPGQILETRGLGGSTRARRHLAVTVARMSDKYVPMQTGTLKNVVQIDADGKAILYNMPYAHYQYNGQAMAGRAPKKYTGAAIDHHGAPMRGPQWDKRMMADRGDEVIADLAKFVGGKPK